VSNSSVLRNLELTVMMPLRVLWRDRHDVGLALTTAEVLTGLEKAFAGYEEETGDAWRRQ
jgi:hypothetical protein